MHGLENGGLSSDRFRAMGMLRSFTAQSYDLGSCEGVRFDQRMRCTAQSYFHGYLEGVELKKMSFHNARQIIDLWTALLSEAELGMYID